LHGEEKKGTLFGVGFLYNPKRRVRRKLLRKEERKLPPRGKEEGGDFGYR